MTGRANYEAAVATSAPLRRVASTLPGRKSVSLSFSGVVCLLLARASPVPATGRCKVQQGASRTRLASLVCSKAALVNAEHWYGKNDFQDCLLADRSQPDNLWCVELQGWWQPYP